jgi:hypothetical protein
VTGADGAGIGTGYVSNGVSVLEELWFFDGSFTVASESGAAVGTGLSDNGTSQIQKVTVQGGTFDLSAKTGAGFGTGESGGGQSIVNGIGISGGMFRSVLSEEGAALGAGHATAGEAGIDSITIDGGSFALTGMNGAGLGSGLVYNTGRSRVTTIDINRGVITASSVKAAAIGTGQAQVSVSTSSQVENLNIHGGVINLSPSSPVGIGAAERDEDGSTQLAELFIDGGKISIAAQNAGIGAGDTGMVEQIGFAGDVWLNCTVSQGGCLRSGWVHFGGSLSATVDAAKFLDTGFDWGDTSNPSFYLQYRGNRPSPAEDFTGAPALHVGWISGLAPREYAVSFWAAGYLQEQRLFDARESRGFFVSLPYAGEYKVGFLDADYRAGWLQTDSGIPLFVVGTDEYYVERLFAQFVTPGQTEGSSQAGTVAAITLGVILAIVLAVGVAYYCVKIRRPKGPRYESIPDGGLAKEGGYL